MTYLYQPLVASSFHRSSTRALLITVALSIMVSPAFSQSAASLSNPVDTTVSAPIVPPLQPSALSDGDTAQAIAKPGPASVITIKNSPETLLHNSNERNTSSHESQTGKEEPKQPEHNEFQQFIAQSVGHVLPIFGRTLFSDNTAASFAPSQDSAVPGDYFLGIGDELHIRATGALDIDYRATIDRNGMVSIPRVGSFSLAGIRYSEAQTVIHQHIAKYFRDFQLYVSLGQLRSIRVYLVGYVKRPGAYTVSALSTLVNTLLTAGGPSVTGSLRTIQVKRAGQLISSFDLYDLLLKGDKSKDIRLFSDDVIYVAPVGKVVAVNGSVNQPAIYEVRAHETLGDILQFAGNPTTVASDKISIERIVNHSQRTVEQFPLNPTTLKRPVNDGDLITLSSISRKFNRVVTLRGHIASPLRLPWHDQMRIKDAIPSKDMLIANDYYASLEQVKNTPPSKENLTSYDFFTTFRQKDHPSSQQNVSNSRLIKEPNWEYASIERLRPDLSHEIISFNLAKALAGDEKNNLLLRPDDVITIYSKDDIQVAENQKIGTVRLEGEFIASGVYQFKNGETLRDIIQHAGGITNQANLYAMDVQRESTRQQQAKRYNQWLTQMESNALRSESNRSALSQEDAAIEKSKSDQQHQLIDRLRSLQPSGRIILNFKNNFNPSLEDLPDLILEDGDKIVLPSRTAIVSVVGAVTNDGNFLYRPEKSLSDYLDDAGGGSEYADMSNIYIIRADGSISGHTSHGFFSWIGDMHSTSVQPGDTIVIPEKIGGPTLMSTLKDIGTILYQFGLGAAAIKVLQ